MKIELDHVFKYFDVPDSGRGRDILKDVSFAFQAGDSLAIVGPSGSGKSTLLNMVGGLDRPSGGRVLVDGKDYWQWNEKQRAEFRNRHIGFVFQLHHLLPQLTIFENVLVPLIPLGRQGKNGGGPDKARGLLDKVGLGEHMNKRPGQLSVGECQRAAVVRALMNDPEFILADEPTGSLDQHSAVKLVELLSTINKEHNVAVIMVTHAEKLAGKMENVLHLEDGVLSPLGNH